MKIVTYFTGAAISLMLATGAAQATSLKLVDGGATAMTSATIPGGSATNELLGPLGLGATLDGWFSSAVEFVGEGQLVAEFYGWEAGFTNDFNIGGNEIFSNSIGGDLQTAPIGTPIATWTSGIVDGGAGTLIDFSFDTDSDAYTISNGSDNDDPLRGFFASVDGDATGTEGNAIWLFLDDSGAGKDDNHDDLAIRLSVQVPVPAAGFLLIGALGAFAGFKRRKKA